MFKMTNFWIKISKNAPSIGFLPQRYRFYSIPTCDGILIPLDNTKNSSKDEIEYQAKKSFLFIGFVDSVIHDGDVPDLVHLVAQIGSELDPKCDT